MHVCMHDYIYNLSSFVLTIYTDIIEYVTTHCMMCQEHHYATHLMNSITLFVPYAFTVGNFI